VNETKIMFLAGGHEVELVEGLKNGRFVVRKIYDDGEESFLGEEIVVDKVYKSPPTERLAKTVTTLEESIKKLTVELNAIQAKMSNERAEYSRLLGVFSRIPSLQYIERFINDDFTHYVMVGYEEIKIVPKEDMVSKYEDDGKLRLLTLFGRTNGDLQWKINEYSDGSGSWKEIYPAISHDEAVEIAKALIAGLVSDKQKRPMMWVVESAKRFGADIPEEYAAAVIRAKKDHLEHCLAKYASEHEKAKQDLDSFLKKLEAPDADR